MGTTPINTAMRVAPTRVENQTQGHVTRRLGAVLGGANVA